MYKKLLISQTYRHLIKNKVCSVLTILIFLLNLFFLVILPFLMGGSDFIEIFYDTSDWLICYILQFVFVINAFYGAIIGIINANNSEKIFILSKPITRRSFLFAKNISSFLYILPVYLMIAIIYLTFFFITKTSLYNGMDIMKNANIFGILFSFLGFMIFPLIFGNCFGYVWNHLLVLIFAIILPIAYIIACPYLLKIDNEHMFDELLYSSILPLGFLALTPIAYIIAYFLFKRQKIEA